MSAILLTLVVPTLLQELDRTAQGIEAQRLRDLARGFQDEIQRSGKIPDTAGIADFLSPRLGIRTSEVVTNARGVTRAFVWDPRSEMGPVTNRALPFVQTWAGAAAPVTPRLVVVSSLGEPLPAGLTNGALLSLAAFEALWQTLPGTIPAGWSWSGRNTDLCIERLDLTELFVPVSLNNRATTNVSWSVPPNSIGTLGSGTVTTWFLRGTPLQLRNESGQAQSTEVIQAPISWIFSSGKWQRTGAWNLPPSAPSGRDFAELSDVFRRASVNPGAPSGTLDRVLMAMSDYTIAYENWAAGGFGSPLPPEAPLVQAWQALQLATSDLLRAP